MPATSGAPRRFRWYPIALGLVALAAGATAVTQRVIGPSLSLFFFPAIVLAAIYGGYGPALLATLASTLSAAFFFVPPAQSPDIGVDDAIRLAVFAGVGVAIAGLSAARRSSQEAERQSLIVIAEQGRELAVREDRVRVSRDLHDGILQGLTGIRLELHDIAADGHLPSSLHERLLATERALATEQRHLRRLIDGLKPKPAAPPETGTLESALRLRAARLAIEWKTPVSLMVTPIDLSVPPALEPAILLMCQEATINALQHGHPSRVSIAVGASDDDIRLTIVDDGRGFPFSGRFEHETLVDRNLGPVTLRERAASLDGRLSIESGPRGSRVEITLPRPG